MIVLQRSFLRAIDNYGVGKAHGLTLFPQETPHLSTVNCQFGRWPYQRSVTVPW